MKKLLIIILVVVAALLIAPKLVGLQVNSIYQAYLQKEDSNPAYDAKMEVVEPGWFGSVINWTITFPAYDKDSSLVVTEYLTHGPVMFTKDGIKFGLGYSVYHLNLESLGITPEQNQEINSKLKIRNILGYTNGMTTLITSEPFELTERGETIAIQPVNAEFHVDALLKDLEGQLNWKGMAVKGRSGNMQIGESDFNYDLEVVSGSLLDGDAITIGGMAFTMESFSLEEKHSSAPIVARNLRFNASTDLEGSLANTKLDYMLGHLQMMAETVNDAKLAMELNRLDTEVLVELNQINQQMQQPSFNQDPNVTMQKLNSILPKLVSAGPELKITQIKAGLKEGELQGDLVLRINKDKFDPSNFMSAMMALEADGQMQAPEAWFARQGMGPMVDQYVNQGLVSKEQGILKSVLKIKDGQARVNGNPVPLM